MIKKITHFFEKILDPLVEHYWRVIGGVTLFLVLFELVEIIHKGEPLIDPFHVIELGAYFIILTVVGVLVGSLIKANAVQKRNMEIMKYKHDLSMELTELPDWKMLTSELARLPSTIAAVEVSRLQVRNPFSSRWETVAFWNKPGRKNTIFQHNCQQCLKKRAEDEFLFSPCNCSSTAPTTAIQSQEYCLPLNYANSLLAFIQFKLEPGKGMSSTQIEIFKSIRFEMALALRASQEQMMLAEMKLTETALAERHSFAAYIHDNLSQNLAYLCLKLDQFISNEQLYSKSEGQIELQRMKDTANQSYEIVRGMIETTYPETTPHFFNLIVAYAKKVSNRSGIEISIEKNGLELSVPPEIQQDIFYIFQEILSNVEKHSQAKTAKILVDWGMNGLTITVADDGIGFNPEEVDQDKHFGIEIMQERIEKIGGRIDIRSQENTGTSVALFTPLFSQEF